MNTDSVVLVSIVATVLLVACGPSSVAEGSDEGSDEASTGSPMVPATSTVGNASGSESGLDSAGTEDDPAVCGDGVIAGAEQCDCGLVGPDGAPQGWGACTAQAVGNVVCSDLSNLDTGLLTGGELRCRSSDCTFDVSDCTVCGDGAVNGAEQCDPSVPMELACAVAVPGAPGTVTCDDACRFDASECDDCEAAFSFDQCDRSPWTVQLANPAAAEPSWSCGVSSDPNGPALNGETVWGTNLVGDYASGESSALVSPPLYLSSCNVGETVHMNVRHWFQLEGNIINADGGIVQVSADGGPWTTIAPIEGALYTDMPLTTGFQPPDGEVGFSGNSTDSEEWVDSVLDLSAFAGTSTVQLRFVFGSDTVAEHAGWFIDDVSLFLAR